jgi:predicted transcriptional regulator
MKAMTKVLQIRAHGELHRRLKRIAAARGVSSSDVAREGMLKHLDTEEAKLAETKKGGVA